MKTIKKIIDSVQCIEEIEDFTKIIWKIIDCHLVEWKMGLEHIRLLSISKQFALLRP